MSSALSTTISFVIAIIGVAPALATGNTKVHFEMPDADKKFYRAHTTDNGRMVALNLPSATLLNPHASKDATLPSHIALETSSASLPKFVSGTRKFCTGFTEIRIDLKSVETVKPLRFRTLFATGPGDDKIYTYMISPDRKLFARCFVDDRPCTIISLNDGWDSEMMVHKSDLCDASLFSTRLKEIAEPWKKPG